MESRVTPEDEIVRYAINFPGGALRFPLEQIRTTFVERHKEISDLIRQKVYSPDGSMVNLFASSVLGALLQLPRDVNWRTEKAFVREHFQSLPVLERQRILRLIKPLYPHVAAVLTRGVLPDGGRAEGQYTLSMNPLWVNMPVHVTSFEEDANVVPDFTFYVSGPDDQKLLKAHLKQIVTPYTGRQHFAAGIAKHGNAYNLSVHPTLKAALHKAMLYHSVDVGTRNRGARDALEASLTPGFHNKSMRESVSRKIRSYMGDGGARRKRHRSRRTASKRRQIKQNKRTRRRSSRRSRRR